MWKWKNGTVLDCLSVAVEQYTSPSMCWKFNEEIESWIENVWLVLYDEQQHGALLGLVLLMLFWLWKTLRRPRAQVAAA